MKRLLLFISLALVLAVIAGSYAFISFPASGPETEVSTATVDTPSVESVPGSVAVGSTMNGGENGISGDVVVTGKSVGADLGISDDAVVTGDTAPLQGLEAPRLGQRPVRTEQRRHVPVQQRRRRALTANTAPKERRART